MRTNITYIISNINKALSFEWIAAHLNKNKFILHFILLNPGDSELEFFLKKNNFNVETVPYRGKKDLPKAIIHITKLLRKQKSTIVHTHLFDANIAGLIAAKIAGVPKRIHTRHHSDFHHVQYPKAVKYDKFANRLSTHIVAISEVVKKILIEKENVPADKISLIHHGFLLEEFDTPSQESITALQKNYNPQQRKPVIGVISRYTEWKGIQYIIPAFSELLKEYPNALLILANANGNYASEIKKLLQEISPENICEIEFEENIFSLYKLFDVFVHAPVSNEAEAFGQIYVEALASGIPCVFTLSGIANEFIENEKNALTANYKDSKTILNAAKRILSDEVLCKQLRETGKKDVQKRFGFTKMILSLEDLYER